MACLHCLVVRGGSSSPPPPSSYGPKAKARNPLRVLGTGSKPDPFEGRVGSSFGFFEFCGSLPTELVNNVFDIFVSRCYNDKVIYIYHYNDQSYVFAFNIDVRIIF